MKKKKNMIEVKNLTKKYGDNIAVNDISFDIEEGDVFGFIGHNGAGKTTTLSMLTTLLTPTSGEVYIDGMNIYTEADFIRSIIGYVPENVQLYEALTAYENLEFFAKLSGIRRPGQDIREILSFLSAEDYKDKKIGALSKGMRQKIGLAQAIIHKPKILFLDEPTSGLDPIGVKELRDIILTLNKQEHITIFMNTHILSEVAKTCKTIGVLGHGKLLYKNALEVSLEHSTDELSLEDIYAGLELSEC